MLEQSKIQAGSFVCQSAKEKGGGSEVDCCCGGSWRVAMVVCAQQWVTAVMGVYEKSMHS
jgi:hypothetical protein